MEILIFKKRLFKILLISKIITVLAILIGWDLYAFNLSEMFGTIAMVLPLFTAYTSIMYKDLLSETGKSQKRSKNRMERTVTFLFLFYPITILFGICLKIVGKIDFGYLQTYLGFVDSGFGVYIGFTISHYYNSKK